jgi:hypothetical protein
MTKLNRWLAMAGIAAAACLTASTLVAQDNQPGDRQGRGGRGGGGFGDPAEFQARMMENIRDQMKVKDDTEWKLIEGRIQKVMDARREVGFGGGGMGRMFRRQGQGGPGGPGGDNADQGGRRRGGPGGFGETSAEQAALDKAIDSNASKEELKSAMTKVRAAKKEKEAKLATAQEELKKVLSVEQEAVALSMGLVN